MGFKYTFPLETKQENVHIECGFLISCSLFLGLDFCGKTSLVGYLLTGKLDFPSPPVFTGNNILDLNDVKYELMDVSGNDE